MKLIVQIPCLIEEKTLATMLVDVPTTGTPSTSGPCVRSMHAPTTEKPACGSLLS